VPDFQALQNAFDADNTGSIRYHLFDCRSTTAATCAWPRSRPPRQLLTVLNAHADDALRFSEAFDENPKALLESMRQMGLEGLIGKRKARPTTSAAAPTGSS